MSPGTLESYLQEKGALEEKEAFIYFMQLCCAISLIHEAGFIAQNIKPSNVFLDNKMNVRLADFGWERLASKLTEFSLNTGSFEYLVSLYIFLIARPLR